MGPEATILLQRRILDAIPARDDRDHIPLMVDMNPQVPSRIAHLIERTGDDPALVLAAMAARLEQAGCAALAMPCNTAHHYASAICNAVDIPFLNMIDLACAHAVDKVGPGGSVGVLASPAVRKIGLFEAAFAARDIKCVWPEDEDAMLASIKLIKVKGPVLEARKSLKDASSTLVAKGATVQLIACSEFSLIADSLAADVGGVDTIDLLAQAIVDFSTAANA